MSLSSVRIVPWSSSRFTLLVAGLGATLAACDDPSLPSETEVPAPGATVEGCSAAGALVPPNMPALAPPAGSELYLRTRADGTQIYSCTAVNGGWSWTLKAPQARLVDDGCRDVGTHFAGPSWKLTGDGSTVVGRKAAEMAAPASGAIPWLLIEVVDRSASGGLAKVSHIQRVDTEGGLAPTAGCDAAAVGSEVAIPYVATYLYYRPAQ